MRRVDFTETFPALSIYPSPYGGVGRKVSYRFNDTRVNNPNLQHDFGKPIIT